MSSPNLVVASQELVRFVIVMHGGGWNGNVYKGGTKDVIPIPIGGIKFQDFLTKLEVRLRKDMSMYTFDIDAAVKTAEGDIARMKITDEFEWCCLLNFVAPHTLYVNVVVKSNLLTSNRTNSPQQNDESLALVVYNDPTESSSTYPSSSSQWLIPGALEHASIACEDISHQDIVCEDIEAAYGEPLVRGSSFRTKSSMVSVIESYHMRNFLEFRTKRSDKGRYVIVCRFVETCKFLLWAKAYGTSWSIYRVTEHTCERDLRKCAQPRISSRAIADHVRHNMSEDGFVYRARDVQGQFIRDFGIHLRYHRAHAGRKRALKILYGDPDKSFQMIAKYLYMLKLLNPGSVMDLQTKDDSSFEYCYFSLAASIRAFKACRPVIVIDATHLKGNYNGVLFVASTKDGNEQIVPLAFGVGDKEKDSSWTWFLQHVRETFGRPDNLLIVSDQHTSIKNSVECVFPGAAHAFCTYHIQGNFKNCPDPVIEIFQKVAKAYREDDFNEHMRNLETNAPKVYEKLMDIGLIRWAVCKCPVRRYAFRTSNAVEVLNSHLKWARKLPICPLLEYARNLVQSWFFERRSIASKREIELLEYAEKRIGFASRKGNSYRIKPISSTKFNVISDFKSNVVDITSRSCTCQVFQMDLIPCSHAAAAIRYLKQTPMAYVNSCYSTQTWYDIYEADVMYVPDPSEWLTPSDVDSRVVVTPANPKQAGRPRVKRYQAVESKNKDCRECTRCNQAGHYSGTCTVVLQSTMDGVPSNSQKRKRKPKSCGICGVVGHTRRHCNDPKWYL